MEKTAKILVVDDERFNINVLADLLKPNYKVMAAINGEQALKAARGASPPDLILLDIMMPEMDGYEVCRQLKEDPSTKNIPVIFVTAMGQESDETKGLEVGAVDYLTKPISPAIVEARIKTQLTLVKAYKVIEQQKERMQQELSVGADIQLSMLPLEFPAFPERKDFSIYATLVPAREVGGDFYDFFFINEDEICLCVGDVSGKGVPAALFMAVTKTLIKTRAAYDKSPASIITQVNDDISEDNPSCMFITVWLGICNIRTGELRYVNAGHNPPCIKRAAGELEHLKELHGPVVGAVEGLAYKEGLCKLNKKDLLILFTDGVPEAMDTESQLYSDERLADLIKTTKGLTVESSVDCILKSVEDFAVGAEQADDITIISFALEEEPQEVQHHLLALEIINKPAQIDVVNDAFNEFCEKHGIPQAVGLKLNVAFDELLSNVINYAFQDEEDHKIFVNADFDGERLKISISDDGIPFNPFSRSDPDTELSIEDREIGGLGIHLVKNMMDDVSYQRRLERNVVTMVKLVERSS